MTANSVEAKDVPPYETKKEARLAQSALYEEGAFFPAFSLKEMDPPPNFALAINPEVASLGKVVWSPDMREALHLRPEFPEAFMLEVASLLSAPVKEKLGPVPEVANVQTSLIATTGDFGYPAAASERENGLVRLSFLTLLHPCSLHAFVFNGDETPTKVVLQDQGDTFVFDGELGCVVIDATETSPGFSILKYMLKTTFLVDVADSRVEAILQNGTLMRSVAAGLSRFATEDMKKKGK